MYYSTNVIFSAKSEKPFPGSGWEEEKYDHGQGKMKWLMIWDLKK